MTKYYSNHPDFSAGLQASSMTGSVSYARSQVTNTLSDIKEVTEVVQNEGVSFLYSPVGDAELGKEMPEITFATSYDKVEKMLNLATRIHSEVLERIDNKFTTGIDASLESLNSVNGSNKPYTTTYLSYQVRKTKSQSQGLVDNETKYYTLAELLDYKQSPISATKEVYLKRVSDLREIFEKQHLDDGPVYLSNKTDEELLSMFFEYQQAGNYSSLKHFQWQEDNKAWLDPLEAYLGIGLLVVSIIASVVSFGAASPTVVAAAGVVATTTATAGTAYEVAEGAVATTTGHTMLAGTELDTDDRIWAGAETLGTLATLGLGKGLKAAGAADDLIKAANKTANVMGDGISLTHTGYDYAVKGEDPTMSLIGFGLGKLGGATLARSQNKSQSINVLTNRDGAPLFSTNNTELEYQNYVGRKLKSGSEPLTMTEWLEKRDIANQNLTNNNDFSTGSIADLGEMPPFKIKSTELEYQNYVDRKLKSNSEPLSMTEWFERRNIANQNLTNNNDFSTGSIADLGEMPSFKIKNTELEYQNYVDRKLKSSSEPLSMSEWLKKRDISKQNFSTYEAFSGNRIEEFKLNFNDVETNITVKTHNADGKDQKIRLKAIGFDESGNIRIQDYTTAKDGLPKKRQEILDNLSKYGGEVVGAGEGKFAGGTEIPQGTRIDIISGSSQFSPEWQTYLNEFPKADLSSAQIESITAIKPNPENGVLRPNPEVYLSKEYLEQHKQLFDDGVAAFVKDEGNIIRYNQFGRDDGAFVFPKHVAEAMIKEADGDPRKLEALLGLDEGSLGNSPQMVVPHEVQNYRIPDGNEAGSRDNPQWRPGGKTYPGGVPEAVIDRVPIDKLDLIKIWENDKGD